MSTSLLTNSHDTMSLSYKKIIKHMAAQAPKVYGEIPPLTRKKNKKKSIRKQPAGITTHVTPATPATRRMSHVEDWIVVDSKESLPDEEDLVQRSPLRNFLSMDFLSDVLPLHTPPASLSDPSSLVQQHEIAELTNRLKATRLPPTSSSEADLLPTHSMSASSVQAESRPQRRRLPPLVRRHSISSTTNAQIPSLSTTASSVLSAGGGSLPHEHLHQLRWLQTVNRLRQSLAIFRKKKPDHLIPMPPPPPKPLNQRRRSEATTQPRFNADTNTYKRDTRYNSDHLRMIACELNMMRNRKLISPLRPRGFLPRRKDVVYLGKDRLRSPLIQECVFH